MASVVKSIIDGVKEKGLGGFFRHLKNEGYLRCLPDGNLLVGKQQLREAKLQAINRLL
ncbi:unnamed protein product [Trifolium pratense]|uniref:Uncharacterized protein n=1 Tax=Trifolium pratense TaxID=57577 RepID=A0ACB0J6L8_TRIPR|nr:unnamed protein product [Trifolium pratense]